MSKKNNKAVPMSMEDYYRNDGCVTGAKRSFPWALVAVGLIAVAVLAYWVAA